MIIFVESAPSMQAINRPKILVAEDEAAAREAYRRFFEELHPDEFSAIIVRDGEQALEILREQPMDVLIVDWALPGISGASLAKALRSHAKTRSIGILMVTARSTAADTVFALQSGVDDYLAKPFDWNILLARLRSLARRTGLTLGEHATRRFPGLELDLDAERLTVDGERTRLTPKELALLKIFLLRPDIVHSQDFLWQAVWGHDSDGRDHSLMACISSLRRKLGRWGARLRVHKGSGYIFES